MSLEIEAAFFEAHRTEWVKDHEGRFVLIKGEEFSFFDTDDEAYGAGIERWGEEAFFIKRVLAEDEEEGSLALLYGLINVPA